MTSSIPLHLATLATLALAALAGTAAPAHADGARVDGVVTHDAAKLDLAQLDLKKPDLATPYGTATSPVRTDRPQLTDEQIVAAKRAGQELILDAVLQRAPLAQSGATPNFYYLRGRQVPMHLRTTQIGIRVSTGVAEGLPQTQADETIWTERALLAARAAGLNPAATGHEAINGWVRLSLVEPLKDHAHAFNHIEALLKNETVLAASPVFENAFIDGGYYMPTERVMARSAHPINPANPANPANPNAAGAGALAFGFAIANPTLGRMPGAMTFASTDRNGYTILSRANALFEARGFAWVTPAALQTLRLETFIPNDDNFSQQWVHRNTGQRLTSEFGGSPYTGVLDQDMDTDRAWDITTGRSAVRILVMDTGGQTNHPDLRYFLGRNFTTGATNGIGDGSPQNGCDNHGTAVAGCAVSIIGNATGEAGTAGGCSHMPARIATTQREDGSCGNSFTSFSTEWLVNALDWGLDNGARVSNASLRCGQDDALEDMYTSTWAAGLLHFAAAGNDGINGSVFPGSSPFTISVSSLDPDGTLSSFSNFGTNCDLCTGGRYIYTSDRTGAAGYSPNNTTVDFTGTSAASPVAAGVGLLFLSQFEFATPTQARIAIFNSCVDLGAAGNDSTYNRGFINAFNALKENAPANDDCGSPTVINLGSGGRLFNQIINTTWATPSRLEPNESCVGSVNNTVFYRFVAAENGFVVIDTLGSSYDTALSVFSGCPTFNSLGTLLTSPTQLACNDDFGTTDQAQVTVPVTAVQTILIKVSKRGTTAGGGDLHFNFRFVPRVPDNDTCATAQEIDDPETGIFSFNPPDVDVSFAETGGLCALDESCNPPATSGNDIYYRFVPKHDGRIEFNTATSSFDTILSLFNGCRVLTFNGCTSVTQLACNDDSGGSITSSIGPISVNGGSTYIIKVARDGTGFFPGILALAFNFQYAPTIPLNDSCSTATVIPGANVPGGITNFNPLDVDVFYATTGLCDPDASCIRGDETLFHSVWYTFTPEFRGSINVNTVGSGYDTVLLIRSSCPTALIGPGGQVTCITGTGLACNDNISAANLDSQILNFPVTGGTTYRFMVASKNQFVPNGNGDGILDFNFQYAAVACPADFNADGTLDPDDLADYISAFFSQPPAQSADFNGDGAVDPDDLADYINAYFAGC